jgi:hypothetical protein
MNVVALLLATALSPDKSGGQERIYPEKLGRSTHLKYDRFGTYAFGVGKKFVTCGNRFPGGKYFTRCMHSAH